MHKHATGLIGAVLLGIGILGILLTLLFGQSSGRGAALTGQSGMSPGFMSMNMDAMFIEEMIPHHDDAIAMGELAITRAEHPELRQLGEDIVRNQTAENAQMRRWYRAWYGVEAPESSGMSGSMGFMMGSGMVDLVDLENAEEFDKVFIEQMIPHHQMAIMMSQMAGNGSGRQEMRDLTSSIIEAQSAEISSMREWYDEWYGR